MILTVFWCILYHCQILSVLVSISISTILNYKTVVTLGFSSNPCFSEKIHIKKGLKGAMIALEGGLEGWVLAGSHRSAWGSESSLLWCFYFWEIWETLEKPSPLINYCITIDDTRIIKNTRPSFPIVS